jgi:hypothetical protein
MNEPAQDVSPSDSRASHSFRRGSRIRRSKVHAPVRPGPVVVLGVDAKDPLKVTSAENQDVVEALSSNGADPTLCERIRPGCPNGSLHNAEALGAEHLVEGAGELGVSIPDASRKWRATPLPALSQVRSGSGSHRSTAE